MKKFLIEDSLIELADSIRQFGVLQPLLVQKKGDYYEIIAGERRWRAAKMAGLKEIPRNHQRIFSSRNGRDCLNRKYSERKS